MSIQKVQKMLPGAWPELKAVRHAGMWSPIAIHIENQAINTPHVQPAMARIEFVRPTCRGALWVSTDLNDTGGITFVQSGRALFEEKLWFWGLNPRGVVHLYGLKVDLSGTRVLDGAEWKLCQSDLASVADDLIRSMSELPTPERLNKLRRMAVESPHVYPFIRHTLSDGRTVTLEELAQQQTIEYVRALPGAELPPHPFLLVVEDVLEQAMLESIFKWRLSFCSGHDDQRRRRLESLQLRASMSPVDTPPLPQAERYLVVERFDRGWIAAPPQSSSIVQFYKEGLPVGAKRFDPVDLPFDAAVADDTLEPVFSLDGVVENAAYKAVMADLKRRYIDLTSRQDVRALLEADALAGCAPEPETRPIEPGLPLDGARQYAVRLRNARLSGHVGLRLGPSCQPSQIRAVCGERVVAQWESELEVGPLDALVEVSPGSPLEGWPQTLQRHQMVRSIERDVQGVVPTMVMPIAQQAGCSVQDEVVTFVYRAWQQWPDLLAAPLEQWAALRCSGMVTRISMADVRRRGQPVEYVTNEHTYRGGNPLVLKDESLRAALEKILGTTFIDVTQAVPQIDYRADFMSLPEMKPALPKSSYVATTTIDTPDWQGIVGLLPINEATPFSPSPITLLHMNRVLCIESRIFSVPLRAALEGVDVIPTAEFNGTFPACWDAVVRTVEAHAQALLYRYVANPPRPGSDEALLLLSSLAMQGENLPEALSAIPTLPLLTDGRSMACLRELPEIRYVRQRTSLLPPSVVVLNRIEVRLLERMGLRFRHWEPPPVKVPQTPVRQRIDMAYHSLAEPPPYPAAPPAGAAYLAPGQHRRSETVLLSTAAS